MATQTLEFNCTSGLTLSCKLFAVGSDTVVATASATERTNNKNRYRVAFTDVPSGAYQMTAFVGSTGGFANEIYDLTLTTDTFYPRSEASTSVSVLPFTGSTPDRVQGTTITVFLDEVVSVTVSLEDATLTGKTLEFAIEDADRTDVLVIANASISRTTTTFTVTIPSTVTDAIANHKWSLRDITGGANEVLGHGVLAVVYAASNDA